MDSTATALTTSIAIFCVSVLDVGDERTSISSPMKSVMQDDFDITIANKMDADHGLTVPLTLMCGQPHAWPCPVIPMATNVVPFPVPSGQRGLKLDRARRKAAQSFDTDLKVQIWGTGLIHKDFQAISAFIKRWLGRIQPSAAWCFAAISKNRGPSSSVGKVLACQEVLRDIEQQLES